MKTKKSIWSIALSLIIVLALVVGINLNMQPKAVNAENDEHITFDVKVDDVEGKAVSAGYAGDLVVTYTVTETTGVDALQLRLGYDHTAFTLNSVVTNNATTLGGATKGKNGDIDNDNVVYENVDTEGITFVVDPEENGYQPVLLITATFNLKNPTTETTYTFSLYNANDEQELNIGYSRAWRIESADEQSATHAPVEIRFANEATVYVKGTYNFTLADNGKIYDGVAGAVTVSDNNNAHRPTINYVWFVEGEYGIEKLNAAPVNAGTYYVAIDYSANDYYDGYVGYEETSSESGLYILDSTEGKVAEYVISPRSVNVTIDSKESAYGETLKPLTFTVDPQTPVIGNDDLGISLFSDANSLVPGTSPITGSAGNANYTVSFTNGTYTVTARNVTIIIADKTSAYGAAIVELTYTIDENTPVVGTDNLHISLSTTATSSSNVGTYPITGTYDNASYVVTFRNTAGTDTKGTYTITSQNINALNYFTGKTVTFDANSHDLLNVSNEKPNWISYTAENNNQTNANTYTITITATIGTQDALNYLSSDLLAQLEQTENGYKYVTTVQGIINPKAVTVTADNKSHVYGNTPATLTPVTVGVNNEVTVIFTVKDANEETITLSTETPVGTYTIVPSATNSNYAFTFNTGTYEVTKETATISISAEDIIYGRELDYTVSNAKVGTLNAPYTVEIRNSNNQVVTGVLPVGDYTIIATVADTDNYNGATAQATFTVSPNVVGKPIVDLEQEIEEIHFDKDTVTWDAVTKDIFGNDLYNTTVTYRIGGVEYNNRSFTATSAGSYVLEIISSNENYLSNQVTLNVYSVTFTEGSHPASSTAEVEGLPATQYRFEGETATQPEGTPTVAGYTFNGWDFDFNTAITENTEIPALWTITQRTMTVVYVHSANNTYVETSKTFNVNYNSNVTINTSNFIDKAHITDIVSQYSLNGMRYTFNGFWNYKVTGEDEYIRENVTDIVVNATENYTFVALYNATPIVYEITYYFSIDGAGYTESIIENDQYTSAAYGSTINYVTPNSQKWFRVEAWYLDEERTQAAPLTMPAHDLTVYGALVFNVGKGDVNGDGNVDTDDISLYRRWIVGGYEITPLLNNNDLYEASEMETEDPSDTVYFIGRVADDNAATLESTVLGDQYLDIRDVSTIRMAMVGGYGFSIHEGYNVDGEEIVVIRTVEVHTASDLLMLAKNGQTVELTEDITDPNFVFEILDSNKDIIIDLKGHTLTLKSFRVTLAEGNTGKILVTDGRINVADGNGVYLTAVDGSVHLDDVTLYDDNGLFVIQTSDHSLHLFNVVRFLKKEIVNEVATEVAAEVKVLKDTHIVVEEEAQLTIEKVVVAEIVVDEQTQEEQVVAVAQDSDAQITITNNSQEVQTIPVQDNKFSNAISNEAELLAAAAKGGEYKVIADFTVDQTVEITKDFTLDGGNHTITFVGGNAANKIYYAFYVVSENVLSASFSNLNILSTGYQVAIMTNLDAEGSLVNVNNVDITCDGECIYANGFGVVNANNCDFTRNGEYAVNDPVYYSALTVGYAGTINATNCTVNSDRNGVATFPSGGFITLNNTNVTANGNGYAIWARNEDYNNLPAYNTDSVITINSGNIVGEFKITDKNTTGSNNYHEPRIVVNGGTFSNDPTAYVAQGYYAEEDNGVYTVKKGISTIEELDAVALADAGKGGVYKLIADLDYSTTYTVRNARDNGNEHTIDLGNMTLDLNGHTISTINATVVFGGNGATIKNGTFDLVKKNTDGSFKEGSYALIIDNKNLSYGANGTVTVENVTCNGGVNVCSATVTLNNVNAQTTPTKFYAVWAEQNANVTINSGNYTDAQSGGKGVLATGTGEEGGATITVNGGTFNASNKVVYNAEANSIQIKGGTFTKDPTAYLAEGYYYAQPTDLYTVYEGIHTYAQLVEAAANGGDYTLTADIDLEETIAVTADMTLRLNGHRIYNTQDLWVGNNWSLISVRNGANLTIKGDNGILDAKANDCFALDVKDDGTITLDGNGTYIGNLHTIYAYEGIVTINGGSFDLKQLSDGTGEEPYRYELNCYDSNYRNGSANFVVKGGSFTHFNPQGSSGENPTANYIAEGYYAVEENGVYTVKAGTTGSGQDPVNPPISNPSFPF